MTRSETNSRAVSLRVFSLGASLAVVATGTFVLFGWWLDIATLKSVLPGMATMKVNTALGFVLCGTALWLKHSASRQPASARVLANLFAWAALLIGVLTLFEYVLGYGLGLDQWLLPDRETPATAYPGRMSIATAASFVMIASGLLLVEFKWRGYFPSSFIAAAVALISSVVLIGYAYNVRLLYQFVPFSSVALHTAALFFVLSIALFLNHPTAMLAVQLSRLRYGLVPQVVTLIVVIVVVVGGLISAVMVRQNQNTERQQITAHNLASAELAAEFASNYIDSAQITIRFFARSPFVEKSLLDKNFSRITSELQKLLRLDRQLDGCSVFDANGINRATGNLPATGLGNYAGDRDWFQQTISTRQPYLGIPVISRGTGRPALPFTVPIIGPKSDIQGIVICGISLTALNDAIAKLQTGPAVRTALIDRRSHGIILAHPDRRRVLTPVSGKNRATTELLRGARGALETSDSSGEIQLAVFTPVPRLPWGVLILQPLDVAFEPIAEAARQSLIFVLLLLVGSALVSGLLARRVTRPLLRLRDTAGRLADGDLAARLNFTRQDEVGDLGRAFDQMAKALAERSAQLRAANEELQSQYLQVRDANRLKSEFLANMSHELRTPLNAIIGFAQLMHDGKVGAVGADQREFLNDILTSADHLLQLINDVLDLSRVDAGKMDLNPESVDLKNLIAEVCNILQPLAAGKRLTVDYSVDDAVERVVIDSAKLKQVLYNYLSNAIKFTGNGGRVTVRAQPEGQHHFRVEVEDTGIGIMPDEIDKLFVAFQQLDSGAAKKHQGTGLGLALSKKIVEAQGGSVGVRSTRNRGSVFYAVLPSNAAPTKHRTTESMAATPLPTDATRLLVIEDNEVDRAWLEQLLTDAGYIVDAAQTGAEAIDKAQREAYGGILLDLILPDTGGWSLLHTLRAAGLNRNTPVIVVTVIAEKGIAGGFPIQDYLVKPVQSNILLESLRNAGVLPKDRKRKIMVLDDDANTLKLAKAGLAAGGYDVVCHTSGHSALDDARQGEFAAVLLDLLMPRMDGFDFLDRFRRIEHCQRIPVIIWTSKDLTAEDLERLKDAAQAVALKSRDGMETVLKALRCHAQSINSDGEIIEASATGQQLAH